MANNRMWLQCKVCNGYVSLGKYYPGCGWYLSNTERSVSDMEIHKGCYIDTYDNELFHVKYESSMTPEEFKDAIS